MFFHAARRCLDRLRTRPLNHNLRLAAAGTSNIKFGHPDRQELKNMLMNENESALFAPLQKALERNPEKIIWWREDDIAHIHPLRLLLRRQAASRLLFIVSRLEAYKVPALLAVEPKNFLDKSAFIKKIVDECQIPLAIHGIEHRNRAKTGRSEFPPEYATEREAGQICKIFEEFKKEYQGRLLPVFVAPFNNIADGLVDLLAQKGVRTASFNHLETSDLNADYDFVDWTIRAILPYQQIIRELALLVEGPRNPICINSHHKIISGKDRPFIDRLLVIIGLHSKQNPDNCHFVSELFAKPIEADRLERGSPG